MLTGNMVIPASTAIVERDIVAVTVPPDGPGSKPSDAGLPRFGARQGLVNVADVDGCDYVSRGVVYNVHENRFVSIPFRELRARGANSGLSLFMPPEAAHRRQSPSVR